MKFVGSAFTANHQSLSFMMNQTIQADPDSH